MNIPPKLAWSIVFVVLLGAVWAIGREVDRNDAVRKERVRGVRAMQEHDRQKCLSDPRLQATEVCQEILRDQS
jgi:hypothetical protein